MPSVRYLVHDSTSHLRIFTPAHHHIFQAGHLARHPTAHAVELEPQCSAVDVRACGIHYGQGFLAPECRFPQGTGLLIAVSHDFDAVIEVRNILGEGYLEL